MIVMPAMRWCKRAVPPELVVVVESISILIIIIVGPLDFAELHFVKQSGWNLHFSKPLILPRKVMARQMVTFVAVAVFLWPAG